MSHVWEELEWQVLERPASRTGAEVQSKVILVLTLLMGLVCRLAWRWLWVNSWVKTVYRKE
jgi:hypothetical protein